MTMETKFVPFAMKAAVLISIGENTKTFYSGCSVIDVTFPHVYSVEIDEIHFRNYYTHWLRLQARFPDKKKVAGEGKWKTCLKRMELMPHAHSDFNSEQYFTICSKKLLFPLYGIIGLRFILHQPSPLWKEFRLDNVQFNKSFIKETSGPHKLPSNLLKIVDGRQTTTDETMSSSVTAISERLQHLWALSQQAASSQTTQTLGRFDVDGNYDINLLSYN